MAESYFNSDPDHLSSERGEPEAKCETVSRARSARLLHPPSPFHPSSFLFAFPSFYDRPDSSQDHVGVNDQHDQHGLCAGAEATTRWRRPGCYGQLNVWCRSQGRCYGKRWFVSPSNSQISLTVDDTFRHSRSWQNVAGTAVHHQHFRWHQNRCHRRRLLPCQEDDC